MVGPMLAIMIASTAAIGAAMITAIPLMIAMALFSLMVAPVGGHDKTTTQTHHQYA